MLDHTKSNQVIASSKSYDTRVAGVMLNEESEVAIGLPCEVVYEETNDPKIVMPRWKINGSAANTWRFVE